MEVSRVRDYALSVVVALHVCPASSESGVLENRAANCRLCPQCGRVVNKLGGCDSMRCGQDAHGGNVQNGCGARFNWSNAQQYTPAAAAAARPVKAVRVEDMIRGEHEGISCSLCGYVKLTIHHHFMLSRRQRGS